MRDMVQPPSPPSSPVFPSDAEPAPNQETTIPESARVDETGAASFPASDPPAVWTWEVRSETTEPETH